MTRKKASATEGLWAIANLCNIFLGIADRTWSAQERADLDKVRKAKILQDISISRTRQQILTTNANIHVRRSAHKIEQDARDVELRDLKIELQRLKIMEKCRELGITQEQFEAEAYEDPNLYCDHNGIKRR